MLMRTRRTSETTAKHGRRPATPHASTRTWATGGGWTLLVLCVAAGAFPAGAMAEQASQPGWAGAGQLDAGANHSCALLNDGKVRCWGYAGEGELGYANTKSIGDDETPDSVGPVDLGGRTATAVSAGDFHTCAVLDEGSVRCWGFGANGRLGYGNTKSIGDDETPGSAGPVDLGAGRTATAISAGGSHTCAVLDEGSVRCWGFGYGGSAAMMNLGGKATAIAAGKTHTCALRDDGSVLCWGNASDGELGYGNTNYIGDNETPASAGPVNLGQGHTATAISAGDAETCAILEDASVRCWGYGANGQLGYGNTNSIGVTDTPASSGPVNLGGRTALAISTGDNHTCARLNDGSVRCWGYGANGRLGYANTKSIGDNETPGSVGPVDLGAGRTANAITAGAFHTCALLDGGRVRCWGYGANGRLGYCNEEDIGDNETPGSVGPVNLGSGGAACARPPSGGSPGTTAATAPAIGAVPSTTAKLPVASDAARTRGLRSCLTAVAAHEKRERRLARLGSSPKRAKVRRHANLHARDNRLRCLRVFGRTPGQVTGLRALARGKTRIELSFNAAGTDANRPPPARSYLVKQSRRPIRNARDFARAQTLCKGACRFAITQVGGKVSLAVTDLRPRTTYYYAVAARDNVSARRGARSPAVKGKTG